MDIDQQISHLLSSNEFTDNQAIMRQTIARLDLSPDYPIILIGGTNGKGSTCAYLTTMLTLAGHKVGTFTSPHMFNYNERICINNQVIDNYNLAKVLDTVITTCPINPGLFKTFTLAAHLYFIQQKIDIAVIEVGIGGLNDITNLFEPAISAITNISYDHCQLLGNTLEQIGQQKAGIFRPDKPAFINMSNPPQSIIEHAKKIQAPLHIKEKNFGYIHHELSFNVWCEHSNYYSLPHPSLRGMEQLGNATLAISILAKLKTKFPVSLSAIKAALVQTRLPGRLTILPGQPQVVLDVAHNIQAVSNMLKNMLKLPFAKHNYAVFGIANDKDIPAIIKLTKEYFNQWFIAPINSGRCISNSALIQIMQKCGIDKNQIVASETIKSSMLAARNISSNDDRIVCFGSFLSVEEAYKCN